MESTARRRYRIVHLASPIGGHLVRFGEGRDDASVLKNQSGNPAAVSRLDASVPGEGSASAIEAPLEERPVALVTAAETGARPVVQEAGRGKIVIVEDDAIILTGEAGLEPGWDATTHGFTLIHKPIVMREPSIAIDRLIAGTGDASAAEDAIGSATQ